MTLEEFEQRLEENLNTLQNQLENGAYKPLPVLRAYIGKEDGDRRSIGIPAVRDRIVQQALLSVLSLFLLSVPGKKRLFRLPMGG